MLAIVGQTLRMPLLSSLSHLQITQIVPERCRQSKASKLSRRAAIADCRSTAANEVSHVEIFQRGSERVRRHQDAGSGSSEAAAEQDKRHLDELAPERR
jgi:hypothetical protein